MENIRVFSDLHIESNYNIIYRCEEICKLKPVKYTILAGDITNFKQKENYYTFKWKWFRKSFYISIKPKFVYLDSERILNIKKNYHSKRYYFFLSKSPHHARCRNLSVHRDVSGLCVRLVTG